MHDLYLYTLIRDSNRSIKELEKNKFIFLLESHMSSLILRAGLLTSKELPYFIIKHSKLTSFIKGEALIGMKDVDSESFRSNYSYTRNMLIILICYLIVNNKTTLNEYLDLSLPQDCRYFIVPFSVQAAVVIVVNPS